MGKKKNKGKGARGGARNSSKDHSSQSEDDDKRIDEELTALASIYQDDFEIIPDEPRTQIKVKFRPYSDDSGSRDANVSACLLVRFLPGYPHKCPKLEILPDEGLSDKDLDKLSSVLLNQANIYAREGRVMIYDLIATAQEFLSQNTPLNISPSIKSPPVIDSSKSEKTHVKPRSNFVCSLVDLFSDLSGDSTNWETQNTEIANQIASKTADSVLSQTKDILLQITSSSNTDNISLKGGHNLPKRGSLRDISSKLESLKEDVGTDCEHTDDSSDVIFDSELCSDSTIEGEKKIGFDLSGQDSRPSTSSSFALVPDDDSTLSKKKDLLLVHFLRMACNSKKSPSFALPELSSELCELGVLSDWASNLAKEPPSVFSETFNRFFEQHAASSQFSQIFVVEENSSSKPNSRYLNDFEELRSLGRGGFGHVALCQNKLDGRQYAVKRIRLKDKVPLDNEKILREVTTLSLLQHHHVVRYYQSWFETSIGEIYEESGGDSMTYESASASTSSAAPTPTTGTGTDNKDIEITSLYIQMEFCPRTLKQEFDSYPSTFNKDYAWHLFRQIVEGLAHIHSQGIIHRDLTPSNIFFDVRNDIKIGDFGLAKFLKLEQIDQDQHFPTNTTGLSLDATGQIGTYFYTAPEIELKWLQINEKVDMYSLGVIFFELWHPFKTGMERHAVLSELKQKGTPPIYWTKEYPIQAVLLSKLLAQSPSDRPSATEILQKELPPRMQDEWLNDVLRMIQASEDTYVYDRVVSTIFNEERLINKFHNDATTKVMRTDQSINNIDYEFQDAIIDASKEVFKRHCAKKLNSSPLNILDGTFPFNRKTVKLMSQGGNILELCHELRSQFVLSIASKQITSFKRYEIDWVYRKAIGRSTPNRFLQGDFDIVGGDSIITEAEVIKVAMDITSRFVNSNTIDIRLNHGLLLESIWSWVGIPKEHRQNVAELLSLIGPSSPQSPTRKSNWKFIRRQLLEELKLSAGVVNKLQVADTRFCGSTGLALARLRGALSSDKSACKAIEDLSALLSYLRTWYSEEDSSHDSYLDKFINIDVLIPPSEIYYTGIFFQMYVRELNPETTLIAIGGRHDLLVEQISDHDQDNKWNAPGAVGVSIALEKFLRHPSLDIRHARYGPSASVLVCSKGGGGLLQARMEFVDQLWNANIRADFVPLSDPSLKEQYEYASEGDFKCLVIITESDLAKVRHLELKKEKELPKEDIVTFLSDAFSSPFRNLTIWG